MNHCYLCEQPVDRLPPDGKQHFHEECKRKMRDKLIADRIVICTRTKSGRNMPMCVHSWQPTLSPMYQMCQQCGMTVAVQTDATTPEKAENPCLALYGMGVEGQTCKGCVHLRYRPQRNPAQRFWKCDLRRLTEGRGSDHKVNWQSCARYAQRTEEYHGG